jgi:hypothetical protein
MRACPGLGLLTYVLAIEAAQKARLLSEELGSGLEALLISKEILTTLMPVVGPALGIAGVTAGGAGLLAGSGGGVSGAGLAGAGLAPVAIPVALAATALAGQLAKGAAFVRQQEQLLAQGLTPQEVAHLQAEQGIREVLGKYT